MRHRRYVGARWRAVRCILFLLCVFPAVLAHAQRPDTTNTTVYHIIGVVIEGNKVTKTRVITRELLFQEGDTCLSKDLYTRIARSREQLLNTSLFNTVVIIPAYVSANEVIVEIRVDERWYWWPAPILEVADPNFNTWWRTRDLDRINFGLALDRYNFRGMNETAYVKAQFGYERQFAGRYRIPFLERTGRWGMSIGGGYFEQKEITIATSGNERVFHEPTDGNARTAWKIDADATLRPKHDLRHIWRLSYFNATIVDSVAQLTDDYFAGDATSTAFLTVGYSIIHDTRDSRAFSLRGSYAELKIDRLGLGLLSNNAPDITTFYGTVKHWWKLSDRFTVAGSLNGKTTIGGTVPYLVQEGLGYNYYVRGYEYYVIDGQSFTLGKVNALFALFKPLEAQVEPIPMEAFRTFYLALYLDAFVDVGRVWDDQYASENFLANEWMSGFGLGLDLVTSYDQVFRGEYSLNALGQDGFFLHFTQPF